MLFNQDHYCGEASRSSIHNQQDAKIRVTTCVFPGPTTSARGNKLPEGATSLELVPLSIISRTSVYIIQSPSCLKSFVVIITNQESLWRIVKPIGIACYLLFVRRLHFSRSV